MYKLEKLKDEVFNGNHLNGVYEGMYWTGHINSKPLIGERFHFGNHLDHPRNHLYTSIVTELLEDGKFKTSNSIYKLTKIK